MKNKKWEIIVKVKDDTDDGCERITTREIRSYMNGLANEYFVKIISIKTKIINKD